MVFLLVLKMVRALEFEKELLKGHKLVILLVLKKDVLKV